MILIRKATTEDAETVQQLAEKIWWPTYGPILTETQIRYMLDNIYDLNSIRTQIANGVQTYLLLYEDEIPTGFASYSLRQENKDVYKLHKLYCLVETKGKGYGKLLLKEVERKVLDAGKTILELNVNKYNPAKRFYEHMGYAVIYEEDIPIGDYWMNDYVMRKELQK